MWGPNTLSPTPPHISLPSPFPTSPSAHLPSSYNSSHISPSSPHTPIHFPTIPTYLPSRSQSVAKLPCDEVSVAKLQLAKLPCGKVTGNRWYQGTVPSLGRVMSSINSQVRLRLESDNRLRIGQLRLTLLLFLIFASILQLTS